MQNMKKLESLLVDISDGIATVTINRPDALNAINHSVMSEVGYLFSEGLPLQAVSYTHLTLPTTPYV